MGLLENHVDGFCGLSSVFGRTGVVTELALSVVVMEIEHSGQEAGSNEEEEAKGGELAGLGFEEVKEFAGVVMSSPGERRGR